MAKKTKKKSKGNRATEAIRKVVEKLDTWVAKSYVYPDDEDSEFLPIVTVEWVRLAGVDCILINDLVVWSTCRSCDLWEFHSDDAPSFDACVDSFERQVQFLAVPFIPFKKKSKKSKTK